MTKIAVLATGHIASLYPARAGDEPKALHRWRGIYSTGCLEKAIALRYDIWVVSTRRFLGWYDDWWLSLLPSDRVLQAHHQDALWSWRMLYARLGFAWPDAQRWPQAYADLHRYGIIDGFQLGRLRPLQMAR